MPSADYIPAQDAAFQAWSINFSAVLAASYATYGITTGQATAYDVLNDAFVAALALSTNPATRTPVTVAAKNLARLNAVASARQLAQIARKFPGVTNSQLTTLGVTPIDPVPTPIAAPTSQPVLILSQLLPGQSIIDFTDSVLVNPRSKPFGVTSLQLFRSSGVTPPADIGAMDFVGQFSRTPMVVDTSGFAVGTKLYYAAVWITAKGLKGPASAIIDTVAA